MAGFCPTLLGGNQSFESRGCALTAMQTTLVLQLGAPVAEIRAALTRETDGRPVGVAGAVLDLIEGAYIEMETLSDG
jgi:hypothetical protein